MLVGGERTYLPTRVERYPDGGTSATRGGTLQLFTAEARFALRDLGRVAPYIGAGFGAGVSRPNVNDLFRDEVRNNSGAAFFTGGVDVPLGSFLSVFADARLGLYGERDVIMPLIPIRGGVALRF
jgi:opacity protein-like surface antigen